MSCLGYNSLSVMLSKPVCWLQRAVLEPAMQGRDLIAQAKTGTGKTLAFGIPIINNILRENEENRSGRCVSCLWAYLIRIYECLHDLF